MAMVRLATEQDLPRILELYNELIGGQYYLAPDKAQSVFAEIVSMLGHELLVAEEDGMVVGSMVLLIVPNLSHGARPWAIVENLIVDGRYRRRGIGRLLMEYALARAGEASCCRVQLLSSKKRREAHRLYRSLGFKAWAHGFRFYL